MTKRPKSIRCPECGGPAVFETRTEAVEYKGHEARVRIAGHWCGKCGEAVLEGDALAKRERAFLDLRARVEGVLSPRQVALIRERLKLSQRRAGELLGGGPRSRRPPCTGPRISSRRSSRSSPAPCSAR